LNLNKRYLALAALGAVVAWYSMGSSGANKPVLEFTKPALPPPTNLELRSGLSSAYVAFPIEIGTLAQTANQALPQPLATVREWLPDAACGKRAVQGYDCNSAKFEGTVTRNGLVEVLVEATSIKIVIPVKYSLTATGIGWAAQISEHKTGEARIAASFVVSTNTAGGLDVTLQGEPTLVDGPLKILKGTVRLARLVDAHLNPVLAMVQTELRQALAALPVKAAAARIWSLLTAQVELGEGSGLWLTGSPEYYFNGQFAVDQGRVFYRLAIASRMTVSEFKRDQPQISKRPPVQSVEPPPTLSSVRMAVPIDLDVARQATEAAFAKTKVMESRADRFSEPVKVKVSGVRLYPAMRQVGLELDVTATTASGAVHSGKLNLAGRPVLDADTSTVTLADVTFPLVSSKEFSKDTLGKFGATKVTNLPRLGIEPFASIFATAAKLDVSRALSEAVPRANQLLSLRFGDDVTLMAHLNKAEPVGVEIAGDRAWLIVDLSGDIAYTFTGVAAAVVPPDARSGAPTASEPAQKTNMAAKAAGIAVIPGALIPAALAAKAKLAPKRPLAAKSSLGAAKSVSVKSVSTKPSILKAAVPKSLAVKKPPPGVRRDAKLSTMKVQ
jgi:hypothetical protein